MPVLIEAISYRQGDHSTSDFSQRYRDETEMKKWQELLDTFTSPIYRMEKYLTKKGLITPERTAEVRLNAKNQVRDALKNSIGEVFPEIDLLFEEVYDQMPKSIQDQRDSLREHLKKYPNDYELHKFKNGEQFLK